MIRLVPVLLAVLLIAAGPRSGYDDASPETRAMQDDDAANPAFLWAKQGESEWAGCAACHGGAELMRGVAAHYPLFDPKLDRIVTLEQRINLCRTGHMNTSPFPWDDERLIALSTLIGFQSRGLPAAVAPHAPSFRRGEALFRERMGQLNLSCAKCHDDRAGQRLGGAVIPEGHPNGYPEYRLEWQGMGTLYRRLRNCMIGVRAEPFAADSPEAAYLQHYLMVRARSLKIETPAVRP